MFIKTGKALLLLFFLLLFTTSYTQVTREPGGLYYEATSGTYHNNSYSATVVFTQELDNQMYRQRQKHFEERQQQNQQWYQQFWWNQWQDFQQAQMLKRWGESRIKAGKASTSFVPNAKYSLQNVFLEQVKTEDEKNLVIAKTKLYQDAFKKALAAYGFKVNDCADASALCFVINYETYSGKKPSTAHLQKIREFARKALLTDAYFQGLPDEEKQKVFEPRAAITMYAADIIKTGKQEDAETAKRLSGSILQYLFGKPAEQIIMTANGFEWKGDYIVKNNKGVLTFNYKPESIKFRNLTIINTGTLEEIAARSKSLLQEFEKETLKRDGKVNDLSYAMALAITGTYYVLTDGNELNEPQFKSVLAFSKERILKDKEMQAMNDEEKQQVYVQTAIKVAYTVFNHVEAKQKGWDNVIKSNRDVAAGILNQLLAPDKIESFQMTETGLLKVK